MEIGGAEESWFGDDLECLVESTQCASVQGHYRVSA